MTDIDRQARVSRHAYPLTDLDLRPALRECFTINGVCHLDLTVARDQQAIAALTAHLAEVRAAVMETLNGAAFQRLLLRLSQFLRERHFSGAACFQRTPSVRLFLPGALGTSWHTDQWYGHHPLTRTFWLPLTSFESGAGVSFVTEPGFLTVLENQLLANEAGLQDINALCADRGKEWPCEVGEYLSFDARTLHGSVDNTSGALRCSLDFRGFALPGEPGNKPIQNYRVLAPDHVRDAGANYAQTQAVKYVSGATGASTKYQHILIEAYARDNEICIVRNEAEIETVASRPVLTAYALRATPAQRDYAALLLPSQACLPADAAARRALLGYCLAGQVALHFVLEDKVFPDTVGIEESLAWLERP